MAANAGVGGGYTNVQRWKVNVQVRASMEPLTGDGAVKVTIGILRDVKNATLRQFCDVANYIETGHFPADFHTRPCAEVVETEDAENETPGWLITRPGFDPVCGVWGEVNGITLTVVSCDTMVQSLAAYMAMKEPLPDDLKPTQSTPNQPPARQSAPPASTQTVRSDQTHAVIPEPERSESGTVELGEYDYNQKAQYGAQYNGQRVAFWVERIARGYKKDTTIPEFRMFSHEGYQFPDFYVDADHAGNMLPLLEDVTANGDAVGRWRVVVVVKQKGTKVYFNPVKIEPVRSMDTDGRDIGSENPF